MENLTPSSRPVEPPAPPLTRGPARVSTNLTDELDRQGIQIADNQEVLSYLEKHSQLGVILPSIGALARRLFGPESELILSVYQDPEIKDSHLSLVARLPLYDENITELLDRVTEPYEAELCDASGYLLVTTDFRTPRAKNGV